MAIYLISFECWVDAVGKEAVPPCLRKLGGGYTLQRIGRIRPENIGHAYLCGPNNIRFGEIYLNGSGSGGKYVYEGREPPIQ